MRRKACGTMPRLGAIVAALKRRDPHALQQLNDKAAVLTSDIERLPFVSPFLIATPLSGATPDQLFDVSVELCEGRCRSS